MKRLLLATTLLSWSLMAAAQPEKTATVQKNQVSAYFLPLKITYEMGIGHMNILEFGTGITGGTNFGENNTSFIFFPFAETAFKNYYNLEKRSLKGKRTELNSGNYWGLTARYIFDSLNGDGSGNTLFISPMWGVQRNYASHISLGFNLGYGVGFQNSNIITGPFFNLKLGFVLFSN